MGGSGIEIIDLCTFTVLNDIPDSFEKQKYSRMVPVRVFDAVEHSNRPMSYTPNGKSSGCWVYCWPEKG